MNNILDNLPTGKISDERFETLIENKRIKLERIISTGQITAKDQWYNQEKHEWVILIKGKAAILFDDEVTVTLKAGDYLHIPKHQEHRVTWTDPNDSCVWLALHYDDDTDE